MLWYVDVHFCNPTRPVKLEFLLVKLDWTTDFLSFFPKCLHQCAIEQFIVPTRQSNLFYYPIKMFRIISQRSASIGRHVVPQTNLGQVVGSLSFC